MTLQDLLESYLIQDDISDALAFASKHQLDTNIMIPQAILTVFENIKNPAPLNKDQIEACHAELDILKNRNPYLYDTLVGAFYKIIGVMMYRSEEQIAKYIKTIDDAINKSEPLPKDSEIFKKNINILNACALFQYKPLSLAKTNFSHSFPGLTPYMTDIFTYNLPFAVNAFVLLNGNKDISNYCHIDFSKPLYPQNITQQNLIELKHGIKNNQKYYPYHKNMKTHKGDVPDVTFKATDGKKILFIRGSQKLAPHAILASKIASFVSKKHFSSERLLNNTLAGSRGLTALKVEGGDRKISPARAQMVKAGKMVAGGGIVDEVTNFIQENDRNVDNFGFSSTDLTKSYVVKIDYDRCNVESKIDPVAYERDIFTQGLFYGSKEYLKNNDMYNDEKLYARLKQSTMPEILFSAMAEKAYLDESAKQKAIQAMISRTAMVFDNFMNHPYTINFLKKHPNIFNIIMAENFQYVERHFLSPVREEIITACIKMLNHAHQEASKKFGIELEPLITIEDMRTGNVISHYVSLNTILDHENNPKLNKTAVTPTLTEIDHTTSGADKNKTIAELLEMLDSKKEIVREHQAKDDNKKSKFSEESSPTEPSLNKNKTEIPITIQKYNVQGQIIKDLKAMLTDNDQINFLPEPNSLKIDEELRSRREEENDKQKLLYIIHPIPIHSLSNEINHVSLKVSYIAPNETSVKKLYITPEMDSKGRKSVKLRDPEYSEGVLSLNSVEEYMKAFEMSGQLNWQEIEKLKLMVYGLVEKTNNKTDPNYSILKEFMDNAYDQLSEGSEKFVDFKVKLIKQIEFSLNMIKENVKPEKAGLFYKWGKNFKEEQNRLKSTEALYKYLTGREIDYKANHHQNDRKRKSL